MFRPQGVFFDHAPRLPGKMAILAFLTVLVLLPCIAVATDTSFVSVESNPPGARIFLDGNYQGMASWRGSVSAGQHTLILRMPNFQDYETTFDIHQMESKEFSVSMIPEPTLSFSSTPAGAAVMLNGAYYADTDFDYGQVPAGSKFSVVIAKEGYVPYKAEITVGKDDMQVHADLAPPETSGNISVFSSPTSALVFIDGLLAGTTPYFGRVETGMHTVRVTTPGYEEDSIQITVEADKASMVTSTLDPIQPVGTLSVISTPPGASVYIDDKYEGTTPTTLTKSSGSHKIRLTSNGYQDKVITVLVKTGLNKAVYATLAESPAVSATTALPAVVSPPVTTITTPSHPVTTTTKSPGFEVFITLIAITGFAILVRRK